MTPHKNPIVFSDGSDPYWVIIAKMTATLRADPDALSIEDCMDEAIEIAQEAARRRNQISRKMITETEPTVD